MESMYICVMPMRNAYMHEDCETKSIIDEPGFKVSEEKTPFILSYREARSSFT
jgi:hypothetical protein